MHPGPDLDPTPTKRTLGLIDRLRQTISLVKHRILGRQKGEIKPGSSLTIRVPAKKASTTDPLQGQDLASGIQTMDQSRPGKHGWSWKIFHGRHPLVSPPQAPTRPHGYSYKSRRIREYDRFVHEADEEAPSSNEPSPDLDYYDPWSSYVSETDSIRKALIHDSEEEMDSDGWSTHSHE